MLLTLTLGCRGNIENALLIVGSFQGFYKGFGPSFRVSGFMALPNWSTPTETGLHPRDPQGSLPQTRSVSEHRTYEHTF